MHAPLYTQLPKMIHRAGCSMHRGTYKAGARPLLLSQQHPAIHTRPPHNPSYAGHLVPTAQHTAHQQKQVYEIQHQLPYQHQVLPVSQSGSALPGRWQVQPPLAKHRPHTSYIVVTARSPHCSRLKSVKHATRNSHSVLWRVLLPKLPTAGKQPWQLPQDNLP